MIGGAHSAVEERRQLIARPRGIFLPGVGEEKEQVVRHSDREKTAELPFLEANKPSARWQVVVDDVDHFSVNSFSDTREDNCLGAVVHVGEWYREPPRDMHEEAERIDPAATEDAPRLAQGRIRHLAAQ